MFIVRPLVWRDLLRESRHRTHFVSRALFVIILGAIVVWVGNSLSDMMTAYALPAYSMRVPYSAPAAQVFMARYGTELFAIWAVGQYIALCVLSTVRAASLAEERRRDRLPLLTITSMGPRGVLLGTFGSILVRALFTMMLALPVLALSRGFGGFTVMQVCLAAAIGFIAAAHAAALTLMLASLVGGTAGAVVLSFVVQGAALFLYFQVAGSLPPTFLLGVHSYGFLMQVVGGGPVAWDSMVAFALPRVGLSILFLILAMRLMRRPVAEPGRYLKRALTAMDQYFLNFGGGKRRWVLWKSGLGECKGNPVYWRERAISVVGQRDHMIRVLYGSGILLACAVAVALAGGWTDFGIGISLIGIIGVPLLLAGLLLIVQPALAFVREKERGGMPSLALTPLTPRQFVMGKFRYTLRSAAGPLGVALAFFLLIAGFGDGLRAAVTFLAIIVMAPLMAAIVMYVSAGARSAVGAIIGAALSVAGLLLFEWPLLLILGSSSGGLRYGGMGRADLGLLLSISNPLAAAIRPFGVAQSANEGWLIFSAILLLCSIFSARRSRAMRNGVTIASFVLVPATLGGIVSDLLSPWVVIALGIGAIIYMGIMIKKLHLAIVAIILPVVVYNVLFRPHEAGLVMLPVLTLLLIAFWQAARYAEEGVFNRAVVAVALVYTGSRALTALMFMLCRAGLFPIEALGVLCELTLAAAGTALFLSFTIRQFNRLVERNG